MDDEDKINVSFRYNNQPHNVICEKDESLSSVFEKFKKQAGMEDQNLYFISEGKILCPEMKLKYVNFNRIEVLNEGNTFGGTLAMNFTNVSKNIHEEHYFSDKAPSYRTVTQGINIYGICKGKKCKAYKKEVIVPLKKIKKFDLMKKKDDLECPECGGIIIPKTLGFHLCEYKIEGTKIVDKKGEDFEIKGKAENANSIQYFNPDKNGEIMFIKLIIEITKDL
jgi:DNA-directed RNA polymerase subunit RPC12/RpoP